MSKIHFGSLGPKLPLTFTDGSKIYKKFIKKHVAHKKGYFILAPSGTGKTYFIDKQEKKHWIDGDSLWEATSAHPKGMWWLESIETMNEIDQRSDVITVQAKKLGLWIMGASNYWLKPDAVVLPHWNTHKKYIRSREKHGYDGGATINRLHQVLNHRNSIKKWANKTKTPIFKSIEEAVNYINTIYHQ